MYFHSSLLFKGHHFLLAKFKGQKHEYLPSNAFKRTLVPISVSSITLKTLTRNCSHISLLLILTQKEYVVHITYCKTSIPQHMKVWKRFTVFSVIQREKDVYFEHTETSPKIFCHFSLLSLQLSFIWGLAINHKSHSVMTSNIIFSLVVVLSWLCQAIDVTRVDIAVLFSKLCAPSQDGFQYQGEQRPWGCILTT